MHSFRDIQNGADYGERYGQQVWSSMAKHLNDLTILVRQLATLPSSEDSHCTDLHCQPRVSISCLMNWNFERSPWNTVLRYDYITYPVWYLAQKPWRTKRVQRSIHSKWEVNLSFSVHFLCFASSITILYFWEHSKKYNCRSQKMGRLCITPLLSRQQSTGAKFSDSLQIS